MIVLFVSSLLIVTNGHCISQKDIQRIKAFADKEYNEISNSLRETAEKKNAVWAEGDIDYYKKWLNGLEFERSGDYRSAIKSYQEASKVSRYEMSSYEVILPLGRVYYLNNQKQDAIKALKDYIHRAEAELTGEEHSEWDLSELGKLKLKNNVEFAKWLLNLSEMK